MAMYAYKASTADGKVVSGKIEAENQELLYNALKEKNLFPLDIKEEGLLSKDINFDFSTKINLKDMAIFTKQFASMLNAGVSILSALDILRQQTTNKKLFKVLNSLHDEVQKGSSLSAAMKNHSDAFPQIFIHMVEAGELSGGLEVALDRVSMHFEKENKIAGKVKGALTYPVVVICVAIVAIIVIITFVLPGFMEMFTTMNMELPITTKILMGLSDFMINYWYIVFGGAIAVFVLFTIYSKSKAGKYQLDKLSLKVPVFGQLNLKVACSRFSRTLGTMLASGLSLLLALEITAKVIDNKFIEEKIMFVRDEVSKGSSVAEPLKNLDIFPPMVVHMVTVGENTGEVEKLLDKTAEFYDDEVDIAVGQLTALMEPIIMIILGLMVTVIVLAIFQPMLSMFAAVSKA